MRASVNVEVEPAIVDSLVVSSVDVALDTELTRVVYPARREDETDVTPVAAVLADCSVRSLVLVTS